VNDEQEYFISYYYDGELFSRCSVGRLTDRERDYFVENYPILQEPELIFESNDLLCLDSEEKESTHFKALKYFEDDYYEYRWGLEEHQASDMRREPFYDWTKYAQTMRQYQECVDEVRDKFRPKDDSQSVVDDIIPKPIPISKTKKKSRLGDPSKYKYEKPILDYINKYEEMRRTVPHDNIFPPTPKNLIPCIKSLKGYEDLTDNAVRQGIKNSEVLKKYKADEAIKEKQEYADLPPKVDETVDEWIDEDTGKLDGFSEIDPNTEQYENPVQEFFDRLNNEALVGTKTTEEYFSIVEDKTALLEIVARKLKQQKPFENQSIGTIKNGILGCVAWINADILDKDAFG